MEIVIQAASPSQAAALSRIALEAKGYWGYSPAQLERWRPAFLTITPGYIRANRVWVALADQQPVGFAAVEQQAELAVLDHLWILPAYIGCSLGRRLFQQVAMAVPRFVFMSDPHADAIPTRSGQSKGLSHRQPAQVDSQNAAV